MTRRHTGESDTILCRRLARLRLGQLDSNIVVAVQITVQIPATGIR